MTWIKICGTTNLEDAQTAVEAGADALGFVFYERSPRTIDQIVARNIVAHLPASVDKIGVFVSQSAEAISQIVDKVGLTGVQLHGKRGDGSRVDDLATLRAHGSGLKVIPVCQARDLVEGILLSQDSRRGLYAVLVDSGSGSQVGGTGKTFDWGQARGAIQSLSLIMPVIVAGGLNSDNVGEAMNMFQPYGVDVVSGVEAKPGKKDPAKIRAFVQAVRRAETSI